MKITVIGSHLCPDTLYALNQLTAAGVEASFQDILSCHAALQTYLNVRETSELYADIRGQVAGGVEYLQPLLNARYDLFYKLTVQKHRFRI